MTKLNEILHDLNIIKGEMTDSELAQTTDAVIEAQYHAKGLDSCMKRMTTIVDAVQARTK